MELTPAPNPSERGLCCLLFQSMDCFLLNEGCKSNNYIFGNKVGPTESCWIVWRCLLETEEVLWILLDSLPLSGVLGKLFSDYTAFILWSELFKLIFHNTFRSKIGLWRAPEFLQWDPVSHHSWGLWLTFSAK